MLPSLFLFSIFGASIIAFVFAKRKRVGARSLLGLSLSLFLSSLFVLLEFGGIIDAPKLVDGASYLGITLSATMLFFFSQEYTNKLKWMHFPRVALFVAVPIFSLVTVMIPQGKVQLNSFLGTDGLQVICDGLHSFYVFTLLLIGTVFIAPSLSVQENMLRRKGQLIFWAFFIPLLPVALQITNAIEFFSLQLFSFSFSVLFLTLSFLLVDDVADTMPLTRKRVLNTMQEGWILIDAQNRIVDINQFAIDILHAPGKNFYGVGIQELFFRWPNIVRVLENQNDVDARGSLNVQGRFIYLHIRILHLRDQADRFMGRLIFLRDFTERRKAEEARQQARDEMFSLLHSISGAASDSDDIREFISASMYQLAYSFKSQSVAVFLDNAEAEDEYRFLLVAHEGIDQDKVEELAFLDEENKLVAEIVKKRSSILIEKLATDSRSPDVFRNVFAGNLLLVPIISEDEFVGLVLLARQAIVYNEDEITRLEIAAEQVGSFVRSDRRRHIASTLSERQRLIRDLHDSVTQRLYALVMNAEAADLGLKSGKISDSGTIIAQLASHARQALKEMRLFLHNLQPIDLQRDGLAVVLLHRLEAVEGRSGIEKTIDIDENLSLEPEIELAFFFIAQEALNNVIKHANATAIKVKLKKARVNIRLEVHDNGDGFNPKRANRFGLGLRSMRERAKKIGAKLRISSAVDQGTKIILFLRYKD